jgi:hypothetical protein
LLAGGFGYSGITANITDFAPGVSIQKQASIGVNMAGSGASASLYALALRANMRPAESPASGLVPAKHTFEYLSRRLSHAV